MFKKTSPEKEKEGGKEAGQLTPMDCTDLDEISAFKAELRVAVQDQGRRLVRREYGAKLERAAVQQVSGSV